MHLLHISVALLSVFLFSCSIYDGIEEQKVEIQQKKEVYKQLNEPPEFKRLTLKDALYTPSLTLAETKKPSWYFKRVTSIYKKMPMRLIMDDLVNNLPVTIVYEDFKPTDEPIHLNIDFDRDFLGSAINSVAKAAGYYATFNERSVTISKYQEVIFDIAYLPGSFSNRIGNQETTTSTNSTDSGAGNNTSMSIDAGNSQFSSLDNEGISLIEDLKVALESLKTEHGKVAVNPLTMTVFIKDTPLAVESMKRVIDSFNEQLSKLIKLDIVFLDIIYSTNNIANFDANLIAQVLDDTGILTISDVFASGEGATPTPQQFEFNVNKGDLKGTKFFLDTLKGYADITRKYRVPIQVSNGTQAKVMSIDSTMYISEQTVSNVVDGVNNSGSVGAKQSNLITGEIYNVFARSVGDDIIVKLNASFSAKIGIVEKRGEGIYLESPETAAMIFDTTVILESGKTKIISGINTETISVNESNAGYDILGFSKGGTKVVKETVLIISADLVRGLTNQSEI